MRHIHKEEEFKFRGNTYLIGGKGEGGRGKGVQIHGGKQLSHCSEKTCNRVNGAA